jgi:hypothetical protein
MPSCAKKFQALFPIIIALAFFSFSGRNCFAQDQVSSWGPNAVNWDLSVWMAGETGEELTNSFAEAQIWSAGISVGKTLTSEIGTSWRRGSLEYALDFVPVFETYGNQRIHGLGLDPVILRWNFAPRGKRIAPYIELSGGGVFTSANLPPGDTSNVNFMAKGGGGIYLRTANRQWFDVGCRWSHISNANLGDKNSEFNGIQVSIGYHWGLK